MAAWRSREHRCRSRSPVPARPRRRLAARGACLGARPDAGVAARGCRRARDVRGCWRSAQWASCSGACATGSGSRSTSACSASRCAVLGSTSRASTTARPRARPDRHRRALHRRRLAARARAPAAHRAPARAAAVTPLAKGLRRRRRRRCCWSPASARSFSTTAIEAIRGCWVETRPTIRHADPRPLREHRAARRRRARRSGVDATARRTCSWHAEARGEALVAVQDDDNGRTGCSGRCGERSCWQLAAPLAYFIPEHATIPRASREVRRSGPRSRCRRPARRGRSGSA